MILELAPNVRVKAQRSTIAELASRPEPRAATRAASAPGARGWPRPMLRFENWKIALVAALALVGVAWSAPNFLSSRAVEGLPGWLPNQQINLGLDLRGGSHLLAEVEVNLVVEKFLETVVDDVRRRAAPA